MPVSYTHLDVYKRQVVNPAVDLLHGNQDDEADDEDDELLAQEMGRGTRRCLLYTSSTR